MLVFNGNIEAILDQTPFKLYEDPEEVTAAEKRLDP